MPPGYLGRLPTFGGPRAEALDDDDGFVPSVGQRMRVGMMLGPGLELAFVGDVSFGEFDSSDDPGITFGGDLTGYIPTGSRLSPYVGLGAALHPDSPLLTARSGFAIALSPRVDLQVGVQSALATEGGVHLGYVQGEVGFVRAF